MTRNFLHDLDAEGIRRIRFHSWLPELEAVWKVFYDEISKRKKRKAREGKSPQVLWNTLRTIFPRATPRFASVSILQLENFSHSALSASGSRSSTRPYWILWSPFQACNARKLLPVSRYCRLVLTEYLYISVCCVGVWFCRLKYIAILSKVLLVIALNRMCPLTGGQNGAQD